MKILFTNPVGVIGGAERAILTCMSALLKQEPELQISLIVGTDGKMIEAAENIGVTTYLLNFPQSFNQLGDSQFKNRSKLLTNLALGTQILKTLPSLWKYQKTLRELIKTINPDIIHSNGIKAHIIAAWSKPQPIPLVWHMQDFYQSRPFIAKLLRWSSSRAQMGIAISQAIAKDAHQLFPQLTVETIYSAVDTEHFSPQVTPEHFPPRVGLVATFARWKGHDIFLQAIAMLSQKQPNLEAEFYIVGGPIYATKGSQFSLEELQNQAQCLGIESKVHFLGFQDNVVETYRWLDIVVHASTQPEPFGLAIVEAMACGKPVIVAQAGGAAELFTHNEDAIGVPPGDPEVLALAIGELLQNPEKRQRIGENARKTAVQKFNYARLGKQLIDAYKKTEL